VLPLDDRLVERANPEIAGSPQLIMGNRQLLFGRMGRLTEGSIINIKNESHAVTADLVVPDSGAEGVIVAGGNDREAGAFTPKTAGENIVTSSTVWSVTT